MVIYTKDTNINNKYNININIKKKIPELLTDFQKKVIKLDNI